MFELFKIEVSDESMQGCPQGCEVDCMTSCLEHCDGGCHHLIFS